MLLLILLFTLTLHWGRGCIYSPGVGSFTSSLSVFHTTSTEMFSGLRSEPCCPAQPPHTFPKQDNAQPETENAVTSERKLNLLLSKHEQGVTNSSFRGTSDGLCSSPHPMNFQQHKHVENLRENEQQCCQKHLWHKSGVLALAFPGLACRAYSCFPAAGMMSLGN